MTMLNKDKWLAFYLLMRMDRPIGTWLLLWPTLWALWLAGEGRPDAKIVIVFALGVFLMRSAGCVINDFADRDFDKHVKRTKNRPLTAGLVNVKEALALFAVLAGTAFILVLTMNQLTVLLSFGAVALAVIYPFMKRYTHLPQVILGMAFSWAIPMGFAAQTGTVPMVAWILYALTILWIVAYDTQYAMVDRDDDIKIGIKSTAVLFGRHDRLIIGLLQGLFIVGMLGLGYVLSMGIFYYAGLAGAVVFFAWQHYLIRARERDACLTAFLNNNWVGMVLFIGIFLNYLP